MGKTRGRKDRENACEESKLYLQEPCLERKIQEDDLLSITEVPNGLDANEWHALHTIGFFEHINLLYGTISEFCNLSSCPEMLGPGPRLYMWLDDKGKKSKISAPQYVDYVMTYVQKVVNDEATFPTKHGNEFPSNFDQVLKKIQKLLFHVVAHIYHSHFREIVLLGLHAHLNSIFAHIIEYNLFYHTIEEKETEVLQDLIHALKLAPDKSSSLTNNSEENKENLEENSQHSSPNSSLSVRGGSGPGAGGAHTPNPNPDTGENETVVSGANIGAVNICDERTSLGTDGAVDSENCIDMSDNEGNSTATALSNSEEWSISN